MAAEKRRFSVAVIGPGALGLLYASRLAAFVDVALIAKDAARASELCKGVVVDKKRFRPETFHPSHLPEADWVLVLVKAHQTAAAARIAARMKPKGVLSLQNGLTQSILQRHLGETPAFQGVSTEGAYRDGAKVVHAGRGETLVPRALAALARLLTKAGFRVRLAKDLKAARLRKLFVNACMNPVTAVFRIRNGQTLETPYRSFTEALAREAILVLKKENVAVDPALLFQVAKATGKNRSSMLQDVLAGRRTEIDQITGALIRLGRKHRIALPTHVAFHRLIKLLEPG
jgi:2-dehydropantoate 2-reductase